jgi:hypothetical protein
MAADSPTETLSTYDPYVAVVFSVAAVEGFLNDTIEDAIPRSTFHWGEKASAFGIIGKCLFIDTPRGAKEKIHLMHLIFTGSPCDLGKQPWQDWFLLVSLRNMLMHMRPEGYVEYGDDGLPTEIVYPKIVSKLEPKGILGKVQYTSWGPLVQTSGVAVWACETAAKIVDAIVEISPPPFHSVMEFSATPFRTKRPGGSTARSETRNAPDSTGGK